MPVKDILTGFAPVGPSVMQDCLTEFNRRDSISLRVFCTTRFASKLSEHSTVSEYSTTDSSSANNVFNTSKKGVVHPYFSFTIEPVGGVISTYQLL